jgi:1-acyl-sn-glycerol-3-phosphate acyltransferase
MSRAHKPNAGFWIRQCVLIIFPLTNALFRMRWHHLDRIPATGPVLLAVNHNSQADTAAVARLVWQSGRIPRFLIKSTVFDWPLMGTVMKGAGQIPVYRNSRDAADSLTDASEALNRGECVIIYPEGTITQDPNYLPMQGKTGVARLALANPKVPVIPIGHWGAQHTLGRGGRFRPIPRKRVEAFVGEPIDLNAFAGHKPTTETLRKMTDEIMRAVADQVTQARESATSRTCPRSDDQLCRQDHPLGPGPGPLVQQQFDRCPALVFHRLAHGRQAGTLRGGHVVEAGHRQSTDQATSSELVQHSEGHDVAGAHDRGEVRPGIQQYGCPAGTLDPLMRHSLGDHHRLQRHLSRVCRIDQSQQPLLTYRVRCSSGLQSIDQRQRTRLGVRFFAVTNGHHSDLAMPERQNMRCHLGKRRSVIDADEVDARHTRWRIHHDGRLRAGQHRGDIGVGLGHREDDETVDRSARNGVRATSAWLRRHQQQRPSTLAACLGQAVQKLHGSGIAKGVSQSLGENQPNGIGLPGTQRPCNRIRSGITQFLRGGHDSLAQVG